MHIGKRIIEICMKFYVWRRYYDIDTFYHRDSVNKRNTSISTNSVIMEKRIAKQKLNRLIHMQTHYHNNAVSMIKSIDNNGN